MTNALEHDFALIIAGVPDLTPAVEDALYDAGCDDATVSMQHGRVYLEFTRSAPSLQEAILGAIADVRHAGIGAEVLRVDDAEFVTASDIARRIDRSRQMVHQYMAGVRGPGDFPPPACHLVDQRPLWSWCDVSAWLARQKLLPIERERDAEVVGAINNALETIRRTRRCPGLVESIRRALGA